VIDATTRSFDVHDLKRTNLVHDVPKQESCAMSVLHNGQGVPGNLQHLDMGLRKGGRVQQQQHIRLIWVKMQELQTVEAARDPN
jgi:hypothetical protein